MVDLKGQYMKIKPEVDAAIQNVIDNTAFINGPIVKEFAQNLSDYMGGCHVIPCANGTDALQIALMSLDLKPGDEVIVPAFTYVASAEVIGLLGLTPVMVDVDYDTFNVTVDTQRKLSKRYGDANFEDFINKGYLPEAIVNYIALLGWSPKGNEEKMTMDELISSFDVSGVSKSPSVFDEVKMKWLNGLYVKEMSEEDFLKMATPYFENSAAKGYDYSLLGKLLQGRIEIFSEIPEKVSFINEYGPVNPELYFHKKLKTDAAVAKELLPEAIDVLKNTVPFDNATLFEAFGKMCEEKGIKKGQLLFVLRAAITAVASTPGGATEMAVLFGREESLRRLEEAIKQL